MNHPFDVSFTFAASDSQVNALIAQMGDAAVIAVDTEADSLHHYYEKVCLIQLTLEKKNFIIDPLAKIDLTKFLKVLAEKPLIFHGADYDLRMLGSGFGFRPKAEVFDTMLAAQLLGFEQFGLSNLIEQFFGVRISKHSQKADWSRRPLEAKLLEYAIIDTCYLAPLAEILKTRLLELGRGEWHRQSCEKMVKSAALPNIKKKNDNWRIKGARELRPRELAVLYHLWHWRENHAKKTDRPPFKVMGNNLLLELSRWAVSQKNIDLSKGPKLPRNFVGDIPESLRNAIEAGLNTPEADLPMQVRPRDTEKFSPTARALAFLLADECKKLAVELAISPGVLAPRAAIDAIVKKRPKNIDEIVHSRILMPWQAQILTPAIKRTLSL